MVATFGHFATLLATDLLASYGLKVPTVVTVVTSRVEVVEIDT